MESKKRHPEKVSSMCGYKVQMSRQQLEDFNVLYNCVVQVDNELYLAYRTERTYVIPFGDYVMVYEESELQNMEEI